MPHPFPLDNEIAEKLKVALPNWQVSTFLYPNTQHGVRCFVPEGSFNRVALTIDDGIIHLINKGCTEKEFEQVMIAVAANTDPTIEIVTTPQVQ
mgnify:FL=1